MASKPVWEPIGIRKSEVDKEEYPQSATFLYCLVIMLAYFLVQILYHLPVIFWIGLIVCIQRRNPMLRENVTRLCKEVLGISIPSL